MSYFIKLTHIYTAKNRLQEAALKLARSLDDHQLESPDALKQYAEDKVMRMNRSFNRCKALSVTLRKSHRPNDYLLYISDLVTLTIYSIKGQFKEEPADAFRNVERVNCEAAGPQLGLFDKQSEKL